MENTTLCKTRREQNKGEGYFVAVKKKMGYIQ
jgi:hypothetical protein